MSWAAVAIGGAAVVGAGTNAILANNTKKNTASQQALETPEQAMARRGLLDFAGAGTYGNYTAGTPYRGSLGDFGLSSLEQSGMEQVAGRLGAGPGENYMMGADVLKELLTTDKYNPLNNEGVYSGLSMKIDRATREGSDALKRSAGFGGSLYSTSTIRNLGGIEARGAETKATTLASLYDNYVGRKIGGVSTALQYNQQGEDIARTRTGDAFAAGALPRTLNNQRAQAAYAEFQRQQHEKQGQLSALSSVAGTPANFGVQSVSLPQNNQWLDVMNLLAQFGGKYAGSKAGSSGSDPLGNVKGNV